MKRKFDIYADPGHAWCKVPRSLITELNLKISSYSYQRGNDVYLEEDSDLSLLMNALKARGDIVKFNEHHTNNDSPIRNFESYKRGY